RHSRILVAAAIVAAAGAATAGVLLTRSEPARHGQALRRLALRPNALNLVDARTARVAGRLSYGSRVPPSLPAVDIAFTKRAAWLLLAAKQRLVRFDLTTRRATRVVRLPWLPGSRLAAGGGSVWVTQDGGPAVLGVDDRSGNVSRRFSFAGDSGTGIAYGNGSLWLARAPGIVRVDPRSGRSAVGPDPERISAGGGNLWIANTAARTLSRLALASGTRTALAARSEPTAVAYHNGLVWTGAAPEPAPLRPVTGQELRISTPTQ